MKSGGEDVGKKKEVVFPLVTGLAGKFERVEIGVGNEHEFGLTSFVGTHPSIAVSGVRGFGIQDQARFGVSAVTVEAISAGDVEGQDNAVAFLDALYGFADFIDHAHDFVTDDGAFFRGVRPSYMCRSLPQIPEVVTRRIASVGEVIFGLDCFETDICRTPS